MGSRVGKGEREMLVGCVGCEGKDVCLVQAYGLGTEEVGLDFFCSRGIMENGGLG